MYVNRVKIDTKIIVYKYEMCKNEYKLIFDLIL